MLSYQCIGYTSFCISYPFDNIEVEVEDKEEVDEDEEVKDLDDADNDDFELFLIILYPSRYLINNSPNN